MALKKKDKEKTADEVSQDATRKPEAEIREPDKRFWGRAGKNLYKTKG